MNAYFDNNRRSSPDITINYISRNFGLPAVLPTYISVFPLEARSFEEKQIFQEEQKTICAIIKPVLGIFF